MSRLELESGLKRKRQKREISEWEGNLGEYGVQKQEKVKLF